MICDSKDKPGDTGPFNRRWAKGEGLPIEWIQGNGHNSKTDLKIQIVSHTQCVYDRTSVRNMIQIENVEHTVL